MMTTRYTLALLSVAWIASACAPAADRHSSNDSATTTAVDDSPAATDSKTSAAPPSGWAVRADGAGPIRVGMTADDARRILGIAPTGKTSKGCSYIDGAPSSALHAAVMLTSDTVVRLDVRDKSTATAEGARVGDTEARVQSLYGGRIAVRPHKYVEGGHYLLVTDPAHSNDRIVFETDGKVVTQFRAGRIPEVENVEGCG